MGDGSQKLTRRLTATPVALAIAAAIALSGCGSSSEEARSNGLEAKPASAIVHAAMNAASAAKSVHISGSVMSSGKALKLDLTLLKGKGAKGKVFDGDLSFKLIRVGKYVYINGNSAFYKHFAGAEAATLLDGKWLKAPASRGQFGSLRSLTELSLLMHAALASDAHLKKGAAHRVDGEKTIAVTDAVTDAAVYVATEGKPYPVEISGGGANAGKLRFGAWNAQVALAAPSESIDIAKLKAAS